MKAAIGLLVFVLLASMCGDSELRSLPEDTLGEYRSAGSAPEDHVRFHPKSGRVEEGVGYRFTLGHCGLDWIVDFDGSFWDPVWNAVPRRRPSFAINSDEGTMKLTSPDTATYEASTGKIVTLERHSGPKAFFVCE